MESTEIEIDEDVFIALAYMAHDRDITVNKMAEILITAEIEKRKEEQHETFNI